MELHTLSLGEKVPTGGTIAVDVKLGKHEVIVGVTETVDNMVVFTIGVGNRCLGVLVDRAGVVSFRALDGKEELILQRNLSDGSEVYAAERPMPKVNGREEVNVDPGLWKILDIDDDIGVSP